MTKLRGFPAPVPDLERAWPEWLELRDPFAGDEHILDPMEPVRLARVAKARGLDAEELAANDAAFLETWQAVVRGEATVAELAAAGAHLDLSQPFRHDWRSPHPARAVLDDGWLAETAEDLVPDIGEASGDRVLGPWADLDIPRRVRLAAASIMVYAPLTRQGVRAAARARESKPLLPLEIRNGLKAVFLAPPMLWRVHPDGTLSPRLPLSKTWLPEGPVLGVPQGVGDVLGRAVLGPDGWWLASALPLGEVPEDLDSIVARIQVAGWKLRRHHPRLTWEDLLRDRAEVLYRSLCEWGWNTWPESVWQSWQAWASSEAAAPRVT